MASVVSQVPRDAGKKSSAIDSWLDLVKLMGTKQVDTTGHGHKEIALADPTQRSLTGTMKEILTIHALAERMQRFITDTMKEALITPPINQEPVSSHVTDGQATTISTPKEGPLTEERTPHKQSR